MNLEYEEIGNGFLVTVSYERQKISSDDESDEGVKTTDKTTDKLTEREKAIIDRITDNPHISQEEMGKKLGLTVDGIRYHTDKLKKQGFLERVGGKKEGFWKIIEKS